MKFQAGHQPVTAAEDCNEVELLPDCGYEQALQDLAGLDRIWLLSWFHRNDNWRPLVLPSRGPARRRVDLRGKERSTGPLEMRRLEPLLDHHKFYP